jgi:hypothetical protein
MAAETKALPIECCGVRMTDDSLCGIEDGRCFSFIAHPEVRRITLRHGSPSAHPVIQFIAGLLLAAGGVPVIVHLIRWLGHGGTFVTIECGLVVFPIVGVMFVFGSLNRVYFLEVEKGKGWMKLPFSSRTTLEQIRAFLDVMRSRVGYPIESDAQIPK